MFEIDREKLEEVTRILNNETDPRATEEDVLAELLNDWHNNAENHQDWLDDTPPSEIANWLASFYN